MAHRGDYRKGDRVGIEGSSGGAAADAAAATGAGMPSDVVGPLGRASREQLGDRTCEGGVELGVVLPSTPLVPLAPALTGDIVGQARMLGLLQRLLLDEDALALVALP